MFEHVKLYGGRASIISGWHPAAVLKWWRIAGRKPGLGPVETEWVLTGELQWADGPSCRKRGLIFTAPREKGMWAWGIESLEIQNGKVRARLGPPEQ